MSDEVIEVTEVTGQESISEKLQELNDRMVMRFVYHKLGEDDYSLDCNHKYHTKCIVEWFQ